MSGHEITSRLRQFATATLMAIIVTQVFAQTSHGYQQGSETTYLAGVAPGTKVEYSAYLESSSTGPSGLRYIQTVTVIYVSGSRVEFRQSLTYENGTSDTPVVTYLTDVRDGSERKFFDQFVFHSNARPQFFFARDLLTGDPIIDSTVTAARPLVGLKVNGTRAAAYAGIPFESDYLSAYLSERRMNVSMVWEKRSGILLEFGLRGTGYLLSLRATRIGLPSPYPSLTPTRVPAPGLGLRYDYLARVVIVGMKEISQEISFHGIREGDTKNITIPELPGGYRFGFVQLFGISSQAGVTADFHGFDKIVIGSTNKDDLGPTANLSGVVTHHTADGRPIIYVATRNNTAQVTILRTDEQISSIPGKGSDIRVKVHAMLVAYKETYQEIVGNRLSFSMPPDPEGTAFDSWQAYVLIGPDSPLRIASVIQPNGTQASPHVATVLPKTVIFRDPTEHPGMYEIRFEAWYNVPTAGIIRVDQTRPGETSPAHEGWVHYFTAVSDKVAQDYYIANTSRVDGNKVLIDASEGYFGGAASGYAFLGLPDVVLLKSGTLERAMLAILEPSGHQHAKSLEPPGTMYMDFYLDAEVPVSWIGRIEAVEGNSYLMQVMGGESGDHFGTYKATVEWAPVNLSVRSTDGTLRGGIHVQVADLEGARLANATTDSKGFAQLRVESLGPFVIRVEPRSAGLLASYVDSTNLLAGPISITLSITSNLSPYHQVDPRLDVSPITAAVPGLLGVLIVLLVYVLLNRARRGPRLSKT